MQRPLDLKLIAALSLGFCLQSYGACQRIYSNYTMNSDASTCFEIYGDNVVFDGNGHNLSGSAAQTSSAVIVVRGSNVTVKSVDLDCNTKSTGIVFDHAGNYSTVDDIHIMNCFYGIRKIETGLTVTGRQNGATNVEDNYIDVTNSDVTSTYLYTYHLDGFNDGTGMGVYTEYCPYYDYASQFYLKYIGMYAYMSSYFMLDHTSFAVNTLFHLLVSNVPAVYLSGVNFAQGPIPIHNDNSHIFPL